MALRRMVSRSLSCSQRWADCHVGVTSKQAYFAKQLYLLMITHSDDYGRLVADVFTIKTAILPADPATAECVQSGLALLHRVKLIVCYEVNGRKYLQIQKFEDHQPGLRKRSASKMPEVPGTAGIYSPTKTLTLTLTLKERLSLVTSAFERWWETLGGNGPPKRGKKDAFAAWKALDPSDTQVEQMHAAIKSQTEDRALAKRHGEFYARWCHPATWIRKERWKDELLCIGGKSDTSVLKPREIIAAMAKAIAFDPLTIDLHSVAQLSFPDDSTIVLSTLNSEAMQVFHVKLQDVCRALAGNDVTLRIVTAAEGQA